MYILENGFKGYITNCKTSKSTVTKKPRKSNKCVYYDYSDLGTEECKWLNYVNYLTPKKKRVDNRKYAYIYTKKGRVLATVDTKTFKAYKVEGCLRKTWKPIRNYTFGKWATLLNL